MGLQKLTTVVPIPFAVILIPQSREKDPRSSLRVNSASNLAKETKEFRDRSFRPKEGEDPPLGAYDFLSDLCPLCLESPNTARRSRNQKQILRYAALLSE